MKRTVSIAVLVLTLASCGGGGSEEVAAAPASPLPTTAASPTPEPSPEEDVVAECKAISPTLGEMSTVASRFSEQIITVEEGAAGYQQGQITIDAAADEINDSTVSAAMHELADTVGKMRVALLTGGDSDAAIAEFTAAGDRLVEACTAA